MDRYTVLFETARPEEVEAIRRALGDAAIPYRSGLMAEDPPRVVFSVPSDRIGIARATIYAYVTDADGRPEDPARSDRNPESSRRAWSAEDALDGLEEALGTRAGGSSWSSTLGPYPIPDEDGEDDEDPTGPDATRSLTSWLFAVLTTTSLGSRTDAGSTIGARRSTM